MTMIEKYNFANENSKNKAVSRIFYSDITSEGDEDYEEIERWKVEKEKFKFKNLVSIENDFNKSYFNECEFNKIVFEESIIKNNVFEKCVFENCQFKNLFLLENIFDKCIFNNCVFEKSCINKNEYILGKIQKTKFKSCYGFFNSSNSALISTIINNYNLNLQENFNKLRSKCQSIKKHKDLEDWFMNIKYKNLSKNKTYNSDNMSKWNGFLQKKLCDYYEEVFSHIIVLNTSKNNLDIVLKIHDSCYYLKFFKYKYGDKYHQFSEENEEGDLIEIDYLRIKENNAFDLFSSKIIGFGYAESGTLYDIKFEKVDIFKIY
jgi:hypothetical protein